MALWLARQGADLTMITEVRHRSLKANAEDDGAIWGGGEIEKAIKRRGWPCEKREYVGLGKA